MFDGCMGVFRNGGGPTLMCVVGNVVVRSVSCDSSTGILLGTLRIKAVWSGVAAVAVIRYP